MPRRKKPQPTRPTNKLVRWVSPARAQRGKVEAQRERFQPIFDAARTIVTYPLPPQSRVLFIGTGMRPLFEAVRGLNEVLGKRVRNNFRYIRTPDTGGIAPVFVNPGIVTSISKILKQYKIVDAQTQNYYLVDFPTTGITFATLENAIRAVNPHAKIHRLGYTKKVSPKTSQRILHGIGMSEDIPRPTLKQGGAVIKRSGRGSKNIFIVPKNIARILN